MHDLPAPRTWPAWVLAWVVLMIIWMPAMRALAWAILWVAYATGTSPEPPPTWTLWAS